MKTTDNHTNGWDEPFRDSFAGEEAVPESGDGWKTVSGKLARRAAARRIAAAVICLVPLLFAAGVLLDRSNGRLSEEPLAAEVREDAGPGQAPLTEGLAVAEETAMATDEATKPERKGAPPAGSRPGTATGAALAEPTPAEAGQREDVKEEGEPSEVVEQMPGTREEPVATAEDRTIGTRRPGTAGRGITIGVSVEGVPGSSDAPQHIGQASFRQYDRAAAYGNAGAGGSVRNSDYEGSGFRHHAPLGFGLGVDVPLLPGRISLETGLTYTLLRSEVTEREALTFENQQLHMLGIPVRLSYNRQLGTKRLSLNAGAGFRMERCIKATLGGRNFSEPGLQWSVNASFGAQYRLTDRLCIYLQPEYSLYLNDTRLKTIRSDHRSDFTLRCGLKFRL